MALSLNVLSHTQGLLCITLGTEEWFMTRGKNGTHFWGVSGEDCVWGLGADGWLDIYSFTQRKRIHRIYIGNGIRMRLIRNPDGTFNREEEVSSQATRHVIACYDGQHVLIIQGFGRFKRRAITVDVIAGKITAKNENLPDGHLRTAFQRPDGHFILSAWQSLNEEQQANYEFRRGKGLLMLNIRCEVVALDLFQSDPGISWDFGMPSPSGKYWLYSDRSKIPLKEVKVATGKRGLFGKKTEKKTYFGRSIQIWEAFPLRYIRTIIVGWFAEDELPDGGFLDTSKERQGQPPVRSELYKKLSAVLDANYIDPLSALTPKQLEASFEGFYNQFDWLNPSRKREDHHRNYQKWHQPISGFDRYILGWADEETFWVNHWHSFSRVDIDGTVWPRIFRDGQTSNSADRLNGFRSFGNLSFKVQSDKSLSITNVASQRAYLKTLDLNPNDLRVTLTDAQIGWHHIDDSDSNVIDPASEKRALSYLKKRMKYDIKLNSLSEPDCIQAIESLTEQFNEDLPSRASDGEIKLAFKGAGKTLDEKKFFTHVGQNCPNSVPALRQLLVKYHGCMTPVDHLYNDAAEGVEFLLTAATTLGLLDVNSMDVVKLYAEHIDPSHQYYFCIETLPLFIKTHGMTEEVLNLSIYLMLFKSGNSELPEVFWTKHGVKAALQALPMSRAKEVFANVLKQNGPKSFKELRAQSFAGIIGDRIINANDPWDQAFFELV